MSNVGFNPPEIWKVFDRKPKLCSFERKFDSVVWVICSFFEKMTKLASRGDCIFWNLQRKQNSKIFPSSCRNFEKSFRPLGPREIRFWSQNCPDTSVKRSSLRSLRPTSYTWRRVKSLSKPHIPRILLHQFYEFLFWSICWYDDMNFPSVLKMPCTRSGRFYTGFLL